MSAPSHVETRDAELISAVVRAIAESSVEIRAHAEEAVARAAATVERCNQRRAERERYLAQKKRHRADAWR
jgi:hypothetical protein